MFVPGKPSQCNLMFAIKARAYPSEAPFRCSRVGSWPSLQILDLAVRLARDKPSSLLTFSDLCFTEVIGLPIFALVNAVNLKLGRAGPVL